jgi:hypothetical protein
LEVPFDLGLDRLLGLADACPDLRAGVLCVAASVLEFCPGSELADQMVVVAFGVWDSDLAASQFFRALAVSLKIDPQTVLPQILDGALKICGLMDSADEGQILAAIKLIAKVARHSRDIFGFVDFGRVVQLCTEFESVPVRVAAYRLLRKGIRTQCRIAGLIIEGGVAARLPAELGLGNYGLRNSVVRLLSRMLKYGGTATADSFSNAAVVAGLLEAMEADVEKLNLAVIKSLLAIVDRAVCLGETAVFEAMADAAFVERLGVFAESAGLVELQVKAECLLGRLHPQ